jgi:sortase A
MSARARRLLAGVLVVAGLLLLADAVATVVWQEPLTAFKEARAQDRLEGDLRVLEARAPVASLDESAALTRAATAGARRRARRHAAAVRRHVARLARRLDRDVARGAAIGRLSVPALGLHAVMVHGSDPVDLRSGPGTIDGSPLPGAGGTAAIAGHRTTYGAPFRDVDQLRAGDAVVAEMPYATVRYRVEGHRIVAPADVGVLRRAGHDRIVLIACHPRFSAAQRIVVFARLVNVLPRPVDGVPTFG